MQNRGNFPPRAYVIGAPKCGTTALAAYLATHPQVCFADPKEPHYFAHDLMGVRLHPDEAAYRASFGEKSDDPHTILMEGSVFYLYSQAAVSAIQAVRPDALFIVMLRNPVEMAPSLHRQLVSALDEDVVDFEKAWQLSSKRASGSVVPELCRAPSLLDYRAVCSLGEQVERLFAQVAPERRLVMFQEELKADASAVYRRALAFLGLPDDGRAVFPRINEASADRFRTLSLLVKRDPAIKRAIDTGLVRPIKKLLGVKSFGFMKRLGALNDGPPKDVRPMSSEFKAELETYFAPDVAKLCALLGRDLVEEFKWPGVPSGASIPDVEALR